MVARSQKGNALCSAHVQWWQGVKRVMLFALPKINCHRACTWSDGSCHSKGWVCPVIVKQPKGVAGRQRQTKTDKGDKGRGQQIKGNRQRATEKGRQRQTKLQAQVRRFMITADGAAFSKRFRVCSRCREQHWTPSNATLLSNHPVLPCNSQALPHAHKQNERTTTHESHSNTRY